MTGRKIIIDTYGGWGAHGGGAFSGKDPTKVDRSGAYIARQAAKSVVAAGLARRALVQVSPVDVTHKFQALIVCHIRSVTNNSRLYCMPHFRLNTSALQVSYAIGVAQPLSVFVDTYGTGKIPDKEILAKVLEKFDFRPGTVRCQLLLRADVALSSVCLSREH